MYVYCREVVHSSEYPFTSFSCVLQYGAVPLEVAAQNGHTETVQRLLEAGANVNHHAKVVKALH